MHYSNGRAAKAGDVVRGKGYNIKHEIIGILVAANPSSSSCNCTVACVSGGSRVFKQVTPLEVAQPDGSVAFGTLIQYGHTNVDVTMEYGQLDAFVALDPATGEVLPPETPTEAPAAEPAQA